jgi:hypothetical protein
MRKREASFLAVTALTLVAFLAAMSLSSCNFRLRGGNEGDEGQAEYTAELDTVKPVALEPGVWSNGSLELKVSDNGTGKKIQVTAIYDVQGMVYLKEYTDEEGNLAYINDELPPAKDKTVTYLDNSFLEEDDAVLRYVIGDNDVLVISPKNGVVYNNARQLFVRVDNKDGKERDSMEKAQAKANNTIIEGTYIDQDGNDWTFKDNEVSMPGGKKSAYTTVWHMLNIGETNMFFSVTNEGLHLYKAVRKQEPLVEVLDEMWKQGDLLYTLRRKDASNADVMNKAVLTESLMENIPQDVINILIRSIYDQHEMTTMQRLNLRAMENK